MAATVPPLCLPASSDVSGSAAEHGVDGDMRCDDGAGSGARLTIGVGQLLERDAARCGSKDMPLRFDLGDAVIARDGPVDCADATAPWTGCLGT